jgi:hypothetical protein
MDKEYRAYPCVAVLCEQKGVYGYGYSRDCHPLLKEKRPLNAVEINNKIATLKVKIKKVFPNHLYGKYFWGSCAEDMAATDIMKKNHSHKIPLGNAFGEARRVRTGQSIPMCETCKNIFK